MWTCCSHLFAGWSAFSLYLLVCHSLLHNYRDAAIRLSETVKTGEGQQRDICLDDN